MGTSQNLARSSPKDGVHISSPPTGPVPMWRFQWRERSKSGISGVRICGMVSTCSVSRARGFNHPETNLCGDTLEKKELERVGGREGGGLPTVPVPSYLELPNPGHWTCIKDFQCDLGQILAPVTDWLQLMEDLGWVLPSWTQLAPRFLSKLSDLLLFEATTSGVVLCSNRCPRETK